MIKIAIVGATGMVGQSFIKVLEDYDLPLSDIVFLASERSAGKSVTFKGKTYPVEALSETSFDHALDYALFSAGGEVSKHYAPIAASKGVVVIDNSSAWRMDPKVPLVVPEINPEDAFSHQGIIANPNCSTIQSVLPLFALKDLSIKRVVYSTYQAVSGSGYKGINDLNRNLKGEDSIFYPKQILHTVIPQIDDFLPNGSTKEEEKMVNETRKILHEPTLKVSATCVRVPVFNGHSVSINVEFNRDFTMDEVLIKLKAQKGLRVFEKDFTTAIEASGQDLTYVSRIRRDESVPYGLNLWCVADNIRKGAASNAIQIMQVLMGEFHGQ
jgi:aspartate-semialdehyde dehydrogenase